MKKACSIILGLFLFTLTVGATGSVTLAWNKSTDPIVVGYNIYYGGASGVYTNEVNAGNGTNITISGLVPGVTYYFAATAYSSAGVESPFSSEVSYLVPVNVPAPSPPGKMNVVLASHKKWFYCGVWNNCSRIWSATIGCSQTEWRSKNLSGHPPVSFTSVYTRCRSCS
jgi:hypothetical protein